MLNNLAAGGFVRAVADPGGHLDKFLDRLSALPYRRKPAAGRFLLLTGSTATSDIAGISAAGATPEQRRLTPGVDAEILLTGRTTDGTAMPESPDGIVSPVVISRAMLKLMGLPGLLVDCGSYRSPRVPFICAGTKPAACVSSGHAMDLDYVKELFHAGLAIGSNLKDKVDYLVIGECVPAGTTTAMAVLTALGFQVDGLLSGSMLKPDHSLRRHLVATGLQNAGLPAYHPGDCPWPIVAAVGDPMQPVAAGIAASALPAIPVMLAGGCQMLAVWALLQAASYRLGKKIAQGSMAVVTTKWVGLDPEGNTRCLAENLSAPLAAVCPDFTASRHKGLRAYEQGHVKEGVGAGGAMASARLIGLCNGDAIMAAIDHTYAELMAVNSPAPPAVLEGNLVGA